MTRGQWHTVVQPGVKLLKPLCIINFKHLSFFLYLGSCDVVLNDPLAPPHSQQLVVTETGQPSDFRVGDRLQLVQVKAA